MAKNKDEFILKEGLIQYGTWTDPDLIVPGTDPTTSFTATGDLGYIRQGSISVGLADTFAEYLSGTPQKIIRKDLIRRNYTWQFTANQFNSTAYTVLYNFDVDTGLYTLAWIGSDAPVKTRYGWLLTGTKVDGTAIYIAIWAGEIVTETKDLKFAGTDYVDIPVMIQAFEHADFISTPNDQHNYGMIYEPVASS